MPRPLRYQPFMLDIGKYSDFARVEDRREGQEAHGKAVEKFMTTAPRVDQVISLQTKMRSSKSLGAPFLLILTAIKQSSSSSALFESWHYDKPASDPLIEDIPSGDLSGHGQQRQRLGSSFWREARFVLDAEGSSSRQWWQGRWRT